MATSLIRVLARAHPSNSRLFSVFEDAATQLYDVIESGVKDMEEDNAGFGTQRTESELSISVGGGNGAFYLQQQPNETMAMVSPMGTSSTYRFDPASATWKSEQDAHNLMELLSRDLVQLCNGYPKF